MLALAANLALLATIKIKLAAAKNVHVTVMNVNSTCMGKSYVIVDHLTLVPTA